MATPTMTSERMRIVFFVSRLISVEAAKSQILDRCVFFFLLLVSTGGGNSVGSGFPSYFATSTCL